MEPLFVTLADDPDSGQVINGAGIKHAPYPDFCRRSRAFRYSA
jgi:hypothetical protein